MFEKLFSIKGRMNRINYFLYTMVLVIIYFLVKYSMLSSAGLYVENGEMIPFIIFAFVVLYFFTVFSIKRLHDMGYSGKLIILPYIIILQVIIGDTARDNYILSTILQIALWVVLMLYPPKKEENKYE